MDIYRPVRTTSDVQSRIQVGEGHQQIIFTWMPTEMILESPLVGAWLAVGR